MKLEDLIEELGSFGPFQILLTLIMRLANAPMAWGMLLMMFAAKEPDWWCEDFEPEDHHEFIPTNYTNVHPTKNVTMVTETSSFSEYSHNYSSFKQCTQNNTICKDFTFTAEMMTVVSEFELVCDRKQIASTVLTIQMVGVFLFAMIAGQLGDLFGRKKTFFAMVAVHCVFTGLSTFSANWQVFAMFRFLIGGAVGGFLSLGITLPLEFTGRKHRAVIVGIPGWAVGSCSFALIAWLLPDWNHISIATSMFTALFLLTWWFVPESVRWLLVHNRVEEAEEVLRHVARFNKCPVPDRAQLQSIVQEEQVREQENKKYSYLDLVRTKSVLKKTLLFSYMMMCTALVFYVLNFGAVKLSGNLYLNIFLTALMEMPANFLAFCLSNKIGRRWTVAIFYMISGISAGAAAILTNTDLSNGKEISRYLALVSKFGVSAAWAAALLFTTESFPTVVRNLGQATVNTAARIGAIIAPQLIFLTPLNGSIMFIVSAVGMITSAGLIFLLQETKGAALKDTLHTSTGRYCDGTDLTDGCDSNGISL